MSVSLAKVDQCLRIQQTPNQSNTSNSQEMAKASIIDKPVKPANPFLYAQSPSHRQTRSMRTLLPAATSTDDRTHSCWLIRELDQG